MKNRKLRKPSYKLHTDYSPIHKIYYNSIEFDRLKPQTKQRVIKLRKEIIGK